MYKLLVDFGPAVAFYLLALAAQVSGYTNIRVAVALAGFATLLLAIPLWDYSPALTEAALLLGVLGFVGWLGWDNRNRFPGGFGSIEQPRPWRLRFQARRARRLNCDQRCPLKKASSERTSEILPLGLRRLMRSCTNFLSSC
jgi:hypothetical protein